MIMKRILAFALFAAHATASFAGQAGPIEHDQTTPALLSNIKPAKIDPNWKPDFDKMIKTGQMKANELLVKFKPSIQQPASVLQTFSGFKSVKDIFNPAAKLAGIKEKISSWKVVTFDSGDGISNKFVALRNDPNVEYVAPNLRLKVQSTPNDMGGELWGLDNQGGTITYDDGNGYSFSFEATADVDIDAPEAWDIRTEASDVVVAVIDTGVDYNHPDLSSNIWINPGEIAGNGIDDDGNGYIDDVNGYDFAYHDSDPMDVHGHGSHCAGTIAAEGNNGTGITGVAWSAQLMAVKVLNDEGWGYTSDIIEGILYAADNGAMVSNNSYGMLLPDSMYAELALKPYHDAIQAAGEADMLFVAAAGNEKANLDEDKYPVPSGMNLPNVVSVVAMDPNGEIPSFSNYGFHSTDIAAPGVLVRSTIPGNQYDFYNGTSMAAPHVAGVATLMKAETPSLSAAASKAILMNTSKPMSQLAGKVRSGGLVNAKAALEGARSNCPEFTSTASQHETAGRAYSETTTEGGTCWGTFCWGGTTVTRWYAQGSSHDLGTNGSALVTLTEKSPGYFVNDGSCDAALDVPPVITLEGLVEEFVRVGAAYNAPGFTATDAEDGDLTAQVQIQGEVDTSVAGDYIIKYSVTDASGNSAIETRLIHVRASSTPSIVLNDPYCLFIGPCWPMTVVVNTEFAEPGYIAYDILQGDLTDRVTTTGDVLNKLDAIGNRGMVHYELIDLEGTYYKEEGYFRYVYVVHHDNPLITSVEGGEYYHTFQTYRRDNGSVNPGGDHPEYFANAPDAVDHVDGTLSEDNFTIDNPVDYSVAGDYLVTFTATDSDGYTDQVYSLVQVIEDITPPEIKPQCDQHKIVELNSDWEATKFCIIADDELDPYPTREFVSNVDITTPGEYQVVYTVTDFSGNSDTWTMDVTVVDGSTPSLTSMVAEGGPRSITISGTAYDPDNNIEKVEVLVHRVEGWNDWVEVDGTEEWSVTINDVEPDVYGYTARARVTDSTGLVSNPYKGIGTVREILVWDPKIETVNVEIVGKDIIVSGTASDATGDLDRVQLSIVIDGIMHQDIVADGTYNWTYTFEDMGKGSYDINVYAYDAAGNISPKETITARVGFNQPVIDAFDVVGGELSVTVTGSASDPDGDLARILIGIGDSPEWHIANGTENFSLTVTGIAPGTKQVRIWALDAEDNGTVEETTVEVLPASCAEFTATLAQHESAGRAYSETTIEGQTCWGTFCYGGTEVTTWYAQGSGEELGKDGSTVVTLIENPVGSGNYEQGECPDLPMPPVIESYQIVENSYYQAVVTGVASDPNNDIDYVVLGLGAVSGVLCEGKESFTCTLDYEEFGFEVGAELSVHVSARDLRGEYSNIEHFTLVRPEQQASVPPVISNIQQVREGTVEVVTVTVSDVDDDLDRVFLYRIDDIGVVECNNTGGDQFRCDMQLQGTDYATMTWKVRAIDLAENVADSAEFTVVWEEVIQTCFTATNSEHVSAGRAEMRYNVLVYALGSGDYLGMDGDTTSLEQQGQPGNWVKVSSCP